jgi:glucosamine--fructose-6-phosphate aminotransferase (isomerizing)
MSIKNNGVVVSRPVRKITWGPADIQKNGYEHFMMKEIHEQPRIIRETFQTIATTENPAVNSLISKEPNLVLILACGTSYHAGLVGRYIIEGLLNIPVRTELASEVNHRDNIVFVNDVIAITQSGETADVLYSLKRLKEIGAHIAAITNVHDNSVSRLADDCIYTAAGPEISVAATKTFMAQLTALYQIVLSHPRINGQKREELTAEAKLLPHKVQRIIDNDTSIAECGKYLSNYHDVFFIGRGINYPIALEGALKMKEISYIHAEGYAAGELKHGPFSLLQRDTPVIAIVNKDKTYDAMLANIKEIKSRGSPVIAIIAEDDDVTGQLVDTVIKVPRTLNIFTPIVNTVAVQLLAYYTAKYNGCSIDFPRNLAKSVTVE